MKTLICITVLYYVVINGNLIEGRHRGSEITLCVNMWDEGCVNGQLPGSGGDDDYLNGGFNPGKRCADGSCASGQRHGTGPEDSYHFNRRFGSSQRCVNVWDEGCINSQLNGAGDDDNYLNGGFNPGKRSLQDWFYKIQNSRKNHQPLVINN